MAGTTFIPGAGAAISRGLAAGAKFANARANARVAGLRARMIQKELENFDENEKIRRAFEGARAEGAQANAELTRTRADIAKETAPTVVRGAKVKLSGEEAEAAQRLASPDMSPEDIEAFVNVFMDNQGIALSEQKKVAPQFQAALAQEVQKLNQQQTQAETQELQRLGQLGQLVGTSPERADFLSKRQPSLKGFIDSALESNVRSQDLTKRGLAQVNFAAAQVDSINRQIEGFQGDAQTLRESLIASEQAGDDTTTVREQLRGIQTQIQSLSTARDNLSQEIGTILKGRGGRPQVSPGPPRTPPGPEPAAQVQFQTAQQREGTKKLGRFDVVGGFAVDPISGRKFPVPATIEEAQSLPPGTEFVDKIEGKLRRTSDPLAEVKKFGERASKAIRILSGPAGIRDIGRELQPLKKALEGQSKKSALRTARRFGFPVKAVEAFFRERERLK